MMVPFMGYFLVEELGYQPWVIVVYSLLAVSLTLLANREFAKRIDNGARVFPLVGCAAFGYIFAVSALTVSPTLLTVLTVGVIGFGISSSVVATMFSLGASLALRHDIERSKFNAYMRGITSTAWMIGPALTYLIADQFSVNAVFKLALVVAVIWSVLWWCFLPRDVIAISKTSTDEESAKSDSSNGLWQAAAFIFCLSLAHSLTFSSLPLFYVQEVGLPGYAPGVAFSVKTFVEVIAIFLTPILILRFGMKRALLATTLLAVISIQVLASVQSLPQMLAAAALEGLYYGFYASLGISYLQSFANNRPARATAIYWNTLMISGLIAGPIVGLIAQFYNFQLVIHIASAVALGAFFVLFSTRINKII
jgi:SET family sugar efflux transporter-like MFS transporter